jgi:para-nitrobenzyl esterase
VVTVLAGQYNHCGVAATGGPVLPLSPATALRRGLFHRVPVMLGQTRDEHRLIAGIRADLNAPVASAQYPALVKKSFGAL